jgi:serine/threonine-protein kinase
MAAELETKVLDQGSKTKGESAKVVDLLAVDRAIGRYELIHRLGHGGMATVYLGRATGRAGFERLVAVKVIHPHLASEPEFVEMFLDEARIAAKIHHPHVVAIHDVGEDEGVFYMVMEYVEGDTLASLVRQLGKDERLLPLSAVLQIAADACEGLAAAHDLVDAEGNPLRLVHRDVSPHNLLVGVDGRVKVVDFGIMKAAGKRSSTLTGQLRGKLAYMSPEQARGKPIDHRTDVFALGAVIWELCTNRRLFHGDNESAMLENVLACKIPDAQSIRPELPDDVAALLRKALAHDRDDRYESAKEMLKDVRSLLRGLDADIDPRQDLSTEMERYFTRRIEYVRAAVRRRAGSEPRAARPTDRELLRAREQTGERRALTDDDLTKTPPLAAGASGREATTVIADVEPGAVGHTGTRTLTTSIAGAPARHWGLWLLLPLLGAAGAIVAVRGSGETPAATEPADSGARERRVPASDPPAEAVEPKQADPEPEPLAPVTVKWNFNTRPQGAIVTINGERYTDPTPVSVELPQGEDVVTVVIEKEGYAPQQARLAPTRSENLSYSLEPTKKPRSGSHTFTTKFHPSRTDPEAKAPTKKKGGEFDEVPDWMRPKDDSKAP